MWKRWRKPQLTPGNEGWCTKNRSSCLSQSLPSIRIAAFPGMVKHSKSNTIQHCHTLYKKFRKIHENSAFSSGQLHSKFGRMNSFKLSFLLSSASCTAHKYLLCNLAWSIISTIHIYISGKIERKSTAFATHQDTIFYESGSMCIEPSYQRHTHMLFLIIAWKKGLWPMMKYCVLTFIGRTNDPMRKSQMPKLTM